MSPGDYIIQAADQGGQCRVWKVTGVYYGALGQEDVVGLRPLDRSLPHVGEAEVSEMIVPLALISDLVFVRKAR